MDTHTHTSKCAHAHMRRYAQEHMRAPRHRDTQTLRRGLMTWWIARVSVRTVRISLVLIRCTRPDSPTHDQASLIALILFTLRTTCVRESARLLILYLTAGSCAHVCATGVCVTGMACCYIKGKVTRVPASPIEPFGTAAGWIEHLQQLATCRWLSIT